jgi:hypothetical protein
MYYFYLMISMVLHNTSLVWHTGLSGGAPDSVRWYIGQCPVPQASRR